MEEVERISVEPRSGAPRGADPRNRTLHRRLADAIGAPELALGFLAVVAGASAAAGSTPVAAAALLLLGAGIGYRSRASVAPFLAVLLPIGFAQTSVHGVQIVPLHTAVVGAAAGYALSLLRERRRVEAGPADVAFGAFVLFVVVSGGGPVAKARWLHDVVLWGGLAIVFHCAVRALETRPNRRLLYVALAVAGVTEAMYAIVEYVRTAGSRFFRLGGAIVYPQPQATLQHPNALGGFLVLCLLLLVGAGLSERGRARMVFLAAAAVVALGTVTPFSRGAWISAAAGLLALVAVERGNRRLLGSGAAVLVAGTAAVAAFDHGPVGARLRSLASGDLSSLYGFRLKLARDALDIMARHPLTGSGRFDVVGTYAGRPVVAPHPHDLLLGVAVFFGIPAAVAFAALLVLAFRGAWRAARDRVHATAAEGAGAVAALVALVVDGVFEYPFWNTTWTVEIVLLLVLAVALGRTATASPPPVT